MAHVRGEGEISAGSIFGRIAVRGSVALVAVCLTTLPLGVHHQGLTPYVFSGAGLALLVGLLAARIQARAVLAPADGLVGSQSFQIAVLGSFVLQMLVVGAGLLLLASLDVKFEGLAAFGLTFATSAMLFHLIAVLQLQAVLRQRARARTAAPATFQSGPPPESSVPDSALTKDPAYQEPFRG